LLAAADLCAAPVLGLDEALSDPHNRERNMIVELDHLEFGTVRQVGVPTKFSTTPGSVRTLAPSVGQHTDAILRDLGYDDGRIAQLRAASDIA
jgi:crotonobetainyl-CoA:carnitine CoA-transferase CaiB-like acyl-CoA transferase